MEILKKLFERHKDWCNIVQSFGCNSETAEDIVQTMYLRIGKLVADGKDISFGNNDVNHFYIFRTLTTIFLDLKKEKKDKETSTLKIMKYKTIKKLNTIKNMRLS